MMWVSPNPSILKLNPWITEMPQFKWVDMLDCLQTFGCMLWALGRQAHDGFHEPTAYCNKIVILFAMYCIGQNPLQYTLGLHEPEVYWLKVKVKECLQAERHEMVSFFSLSIDLRFAACTNECIPWVWKSGARWIFKSWCQGPLTLDHKHKHWQAVCLLSVASFAG